jgi:FkbM family methyltransferase
MSSIDIINRNNPKQIIRLSREICNIYGPEFSDNFEYFFSSVEPEQINGYEVVDFSKPKLHKVIGFDLHPIQFPSASEPISTAFQYLEFAQLKPGDVVLDLGAYSGLTSILFKEKVGKEGQVIAVDADEVTLESTLLNIDLYEKATGNIIEVCYSAVWNHNDGISFCSEGAMGSSTAERIGERIVREQIVPSATLLKIVEHFKLKKVDFIKCDIEGAEKVIFNDPKFFEQFRPRIIIESHGVEITDHLLKLFESYNYKCSQQPQVGTKTFSPLIECVPE